MEIPIIFKSDDEFNSKSIKDVKRNNNWVEFIAHITQFGQSGIEETNENLQLLIEHEHDPLKRAVLLTGIGRCKIREGHFLEGAKIFGNAWNLTNVKNSEERAFILLEMASFLVTIGTHDMAMLLLDRMESLTSSDYLKKISHYYRLVNELRNGNLNVEADLIESKAYFEKINSTSTVAYHLKNLGNLYRRQGDFQKTELCYQEAMEISEKYHHPQIKSAIYHDLGMMNFHQKNWDEGFAYLEKSYNSANSFYTKSFAQASIGFIHFKLKNYHKASEHFNQSLDIAIQEGVFYMIHGNCYYLGSCYKNENRKKLAQYFFKKGYDSAKTLMDSGFPVQGDLQKAITGYIDFLEDSSIIAQHENVDLSFTLEKSLKEIRAIFQGGIIEEMIKSKRKVREAAKAFNMPERTLFNIRKKTANYIVNGIPDYCADVLNKNEGKSWNEINSIFEQEMLAFLYKSYGNRKKILSEKLDVSYAHTLKLTDGLDQQLMVRG